MIRVVVQIIGTYQRHMGINDYIIQEKWLNSFGNKANDFVFLLSKVISYKSGELDRSALLGYKLLGEVLSFLTVQSFI
jgi:hypothetical protein